MPGQFKTKLAFSLHSYTILTIHIVFSSVIQLGNFSTKTRQAVEKDMLLLIQEFLPLWLSLKSHEDKNSF